MLSILRRIFGPPAHLSYVGGRLVRQQRRTEGCHRCVFDVPCDLCQFPVADQKRHGFTPCHEARTVYRIVHEPARKTIFITPAN